MPTFSDIFQNSKHEVYYCQKFKYDLKSKEFNGFVQKKSVEMKILHTIPYITYEVEDDILWK